MTKGKTEKAEPAAPGQEPRGRAFRPTQAQRGFVAAAAGLRVPPRVICQMLPGAKPGETVSITGHMLRDYFSRELREGLTLVVALAGARLCQRALSCDDRGALAAQMMILNARGWKLPAEPEPQEPELSMKALSREERHELRRLLEKATPRREGKGEGAEDDAPRVRSPSQRFASSPSSGGRAVSRSSREKD